MERIRPWVRWNNPQPTDEQCRDVNFELNRLDLIKREVQDIVMSIIKPVLYRVETYIVPEVNKFPVQKVINEIDNTKIANQQNVTEENTLENSTQNEDDKSSLSQNKYVEYVKFSVEDNKSIEIVKDLTNKEDTVHSRQFNNDVMYYNNEKTLHCFGESFNLQETELQTSIRLQDGLYPAKQFKRFNSLMSIDEISESSESRLNDLCHHGYKNGCTATIPSPEEISEEVFKENWLQKIEILRQREDALTAKETSLQDRERQLFKREREVRIAERVLKDKLKQVEQQLKQLRDTECLDRRLEKVGRILKSDEFKESSHKLQINEPTNLEKIKSIPSSVDTCEKPKEPDRKSKTVTRSSCSSRKSSHVASRSHLYSSMRFKERPKISYDDLNSTLSADVGDSSFVRTSERFNPELYKNPYVFKRSASERWTRQQNNAIGAKAQDAFNAEERTQHAVEEDKVLRRLSENICATQDKDTKFQHYGLVDCIPDYIPDNVQCKTECNPSNEGRFLHHNLETQNKLGHQKQVVSTSKDRPISWNEESNEWLQKKRQAYNQANKKLVENKENFKCNTVEKSNRSSKKDVKSKIFTIFR